MNEPYFSIVIPVYNRRREIRRAIESCLAQEFSDFELLLVDDASTDDSIQEMESYCDKRIHLIRHVTNQGECPARNTGVDHARGKWIVFVDSDHSLKPGALARIRRQIESEDTSVDRFGFMQDWDTGIVTPQPAPSGEVLDYKGWLGFVQDSALSDFLLCTKRKTFETVRWPNSSVAPTEYHLDFSSRFSTRLVPEILAVQYTDSSNRLTAGHNRPSRSKLKQRAADDVESKLRIITKHGAALQRYAPRLHEISYRVLVLSCFIDGQWARGFRYGAEYFARCKFNWNGALSIALAGIWTEGFLRVRHQKMLRST